MSVYTHHVCIYIHMYVCIFIYECVFVNSHWAVLKSARKCDGSFLMHLLNTFIYLTLSSSNMLVYKLPQGKVNKKHIDTCVKAARMYSKKIITLIS